MAAPSQPSEPPIPGETSPSEPPPAIPGLAHFDPAVLDDTGTWPELDALADEDEPDPAAAPENKKPADPS